MVGAGEMDETASKQARGWRRVYGLETVTTVDTTTHETRALLLTMIARKLLPCEAAGWAWPACEGLPAT